MNLLNYLKKNIVEVLVFAISLIGIIFYHYQNMFFYPYYENDEGIYQSQAWAISQLKSLTPYTYWYDHAPAGWIILNIATNLIGGFFKFNISGMPSMDTGRIVILLFKIITSVLIYFIVKNITNKYYLAAIAMLTSAIGPLAVYYQRRILLDNIMVMSVITSLFFLSRKKIGIIAIMVSGFFFGLSVLIKESAIFFLPGFITLVLLRTNKERRFVITSLWCMFAGTILLIYPLFAYLKTELFPSQERVSLLGTIAYHSSRGRSLPFWDRNSDFLYNLSIWQLKDSNYLILVGISLMIGALMLLVNKNKYLLVTMILLASMIGFMLRGGIVIDFYILPIIPFVAILIAVILNILIEDYSVKKFIIIPSTLLIMSVCLVMSFNSKFGKELVNNKDNTQLAKSIDYIRKNINPDTKFIVDYSMWLDLRENNSFNNAHYFYKLDVDPEVKKDVFNNDWKKVEYVAASHQTYRTISESEAPILKKTMDNAFLLADFRPDYEYTTDHTFNYWSVNGSWSSIFKVNNNPDFLNKLNNTYFPKFVSDTGQTIDDQTKFTTSEGQSYTMLRALYSDNREMFDKAWKWTKDVLHTRGSDSLFSWKYGLYNGEIKVLDKESATDADLDIAYALIKASEKWKDNSYLEIAKQIIEDIYKYRVREYNGKKFLLPFSSNESNGFEILNPSYFSPAYYKKFATIDPTNDWSKLTEDTYWALDEMSQNRVLFPDWIKYNIKDNKFESAAEFMKNPKTDNFSYDAMRIFWRIGYDYLDTKDSRSYNLLTKFLPFIEQEAKKGILYTSYNPKGEKAIDYDTGGMNSMMSIPLFITGSKFENRVWKDKVLRATNYKDASYQKNEIYYDQNMAWFSFYLNYKYYGLI